MPKKIEVYLDILHIYLSEVVAEFPPSARRNLYGSTFAEQCQNVLKVLAKSIKSSWLNFQSAKALNDSPLKDKTWLYLIGTNNYHSLSFLEKELPDTVYVSPFRFQKEGVSITTLIYPSRFFLLIRHLPLFFRLLYQNKVPIKRCWDAAFKVTGMYESSLLLLQKHQPKSIVFSNDHTLEPRALLLAARQLNIPTFFIQHACVRPDFPPLCFTHSFLEGQDALDKYKLSGTIDGGVSLVGIPRMDSYLTTKNTKSKVTRIGLCSNLIDDLQAIQSVLTFLESQFPTLQITYRPHPSDHRALSISSKVRWSNSRKESPYEFLSQQDLIVAGNTSIHYEAAVLNVVSVYYQFDPSGKVEDMYNFVANKLVEEANDLEQLRTIIQQNVQQKQNIQQRANYYNAVLNTPNEGKSKTLVLAKLTELLKLS